MRFYVNVRIVILLSLFQEGFLLITPPSPPGCGPRAVPHRIRAPSRDHDNGGLRDQWTRGRVQMVIRVKVWGEM